MFDNLALHACLLSHRKGRQRLQHPHCTAVTLHLYQHNHQDILVFHLLKVECQARRRLLCPQALACHLLNPQVIQL